MGSHMIIGSAVGAFGGKLLRLGASIEPPHDPRQPLSGGRGSFRLSSMTSALGTLPSRMALSSSGLRNRL